MAAAIDSSIRRCATAFAMSEARPCAGCPVPYFTDVIRHADLRYRPDSPVRPAAASRRRLFPRNLPCGRFGRASGRRRAASTAIYYLLCDGAYSSWHRIRSDEVWHFYAGDPIEVWVLDERDGLTIHRLGNPLTHPGTVFQAVVRAGSWFGALRVAGACRARRLHGGAGLRVRGIRTGRRGRAGRRVSRLRGTRRAACPAHRHVTVTEGREARADGACSARSRPNPFRMP